MISPAVRASLEETLRRFEEETTNQLVVVTFPGLEGEVLEDFSTHLAEQWKIGQKGKDNGVILLIFKNDRQVRIEVGYGLEGALPDATAKLIIENEIVPRFREGRYDEGIERAVDAILATTKGEYRSEPAIPEAKSFVFAMLMGALLGLLMPIQVLQFLLVIGALNIIFGWITKEYEILIYGLLLGILPAVVYVISGRPSRGPVTLSHRGYYGGSGGLEGGLGGGGFGGGFGGGGGSFGGGGASGRW